MTATVEGAAKSASVERRGKSIPSIVPPRPQVNLLPPEVRAARALSRVKRWLAAAVVLAVLVSAGVVVLGMLTQQGAQQELDAEATRTDALQAEKQKYAEVPLVLGELDRVRTARELSMATDILWQDYIAAIAATAPEGVSVESMTVLVPGPNALPPMAVSPLDGAAVGTITFTANSSSVPDTAAWVDGLTTVPGLTDAWFSAATLTESEDLAYYAVTGTVNVNADALSERFVITEEEQQ